MAARVEFEYATFQTPGTEPVTETPRTMLYYACIDEDLVLDLEGQKIFNIWGTGRKKLRLSLCVLD